ncbi:hypothetical protein WJX73_010541 [Symbiochloris irregularis]|uniref:Protein kinase domain-containing protein n=1 Tax=Symbiochloris irregularis TaxID=706552 RepID=A0AAW1PBR6_9CHLO
MLQIQVARSRPHQVPRRAIPWAPTCGLGVSMDDVDHLSLFQLALSANEQRMARDLATLSESSQLIDDLARRICATEQRLLDTSLLPCDPGTYAYEPVSGRSYDALPEDVLRWYFEALAGAFAEDDSILFPAACSPRFSAAVGGLKPEKVVEAVLFHQVYEPLAHLATALDQTPLYYQVGPVGGADCDAGLHVLLAAQALRVALTVVESKTHCTFSLTRNTWPDTHWTRDTDAGRHLRAGIAQLFGYLKVVKLAFGILNHYSAHVFVTRVHPAALGQMMEHSGQHAEVRRAYRRFSKLALAHYHAVQESNQARAGSPQQEQSQPQPPPPAPSPSQGTETSTAPVPSLTQRFQSWEVGYSEQSLQLEAAVYQHLRSVQGTAVPSLLAVGANITSMLPFLATEYHQQPQRPRTFSQAQCEQAVEALRTIHDEGVLHKDIHLGNCLVAAQGMLWASKAMNLSSPPAGTAKAVLLCLECMTQHGFDSTEARPLQHLAAYVCASGRACADRGPSLGTRHVATGKTVGPPGRLAEAVQEPRCQHDEDLPHILCGQKQAG